MMLAWLNERLFVTPTYLWMGTPIVTPPSSLAEATSTVDDDTRPDHLPNRELRLCSPPCFLSGMRVVQVLVAEEKRETVLGVLDDERVDYVIVTEESANGSSVLVEFPLPAEAVEYILDALTDAGVESGHVVVLSAESAMTEQFEALEERFVAGEDEDASIAHEEIRTKAHGMQPDRRTYYAMTLLSAVVAVVGLLLDSPALVVGSMVIAPQVGAALLTSVGAVIDDREMVTDGLRSQVGGLALAVVGATLFGFGLKSAAFVPTTLSLTTVAQISQRISPGFLSFAVAVAAGAAAAFGLATALPVSLVGVMIAAALIPAAAAVGIGIAWGFPGVAAGAFVLLVVNAASINLASIVVLWYLGYRPDDWTADDRRPVVARLREHATTVLTVGLLVAVLVVTGAAISEQVVVENQANRAVEEVLARPAYADLTLLGVQVEFAGLPGVTTAPEVTVLVSRPDGAAYPGLAQALSEQVATDIGRPLPVTVEYRDRSSYTPSDHVVPVPGSEGGRMGTGTSASAGTA